MGKLYSDSQFVLVVDVFQSYSNFYCFFTSIADHGNHHRQLQYLPMGKVNSKLCTGESTRDYSQQTGYIRPRVEFHIWKIQQWNVSVCVCVCIYICACVCVCYVYDTVTMFKVKVGVHLYSNLTVVTIMSGWWLTISCSQRE